MTHTDDEPTGLAPMSRRRMMKMTAAGAGAAVAGKSVSTFSGSAPIGTARAGVPLAAVGFMVGVAVGEWALRRVTEYLDQGDPDGTLPADIVLNAVWDRIETRYSVNQSMFVDNMNIIERIGHVEFHEAKLAAFEKLEHDPAASQEEVLEAAENAASAHLVTVQENFLRSWNEAVVELYALWDMLDDHEDLDAEEDVFAHYHDEDGEDSLDRDRDIPPRTWFDGYLQGPSKRFELYDGSEVECERPGIAGEDAGYGGDTTWFWAPPELTSQDDNYDYAPTDRLRFPGIWLQGGYDYDDSFLAYNRWATVWNKLETQHDQLLDDISIWVSAVYNDIQTGELETGELLTPSDVAELLPEEEEGSRAVADLLALNYPVDLDHEYHILLNLDVADVNMYGILGVSDEISVEVGDTIDPSARNEQYFFAHDLADLHGEWAHFETGVDGGELVFTEEPLADVVYQIETGHGELVEVPYADLVENDDGDYVVDLSQDLENPITEVEKVDFFADTDETQNATINLRNEFTIVSITDSAGSEVEDPVQYEKPVETHTDDNYMTQEDFEEATAEWEDLVSRVEDEVGDNGDSGVGLGDWNLPALGEIPTAAVIAVAAIAAYLGFAND